MLFRSPVEFPSRFYFPCWVQIQNTHNNVWPFTHFHKYFLSFSKQEGGKTLTQTKAKGFHKQVSAVRLPVWWTSCPAGWAWRSGSPWLPGRKWRRLHSWGTRRCCTTSRHLLITNTHKTKSTLAEKLPQLVSLFLCCCCLQGFSGPPDCRVKHPAQLGAPGI